MPEKNSHEPMRITNHTTLCFYSRVSACQQIDRLMRKPIKVCFVTIFC
uniref:Secreted protein n=1 Tax=Mesocestoides corti TaxID=53468 RepID=A0A5K3FAT0_MESCO